MLRWGVRHHDGCDAAHDCAPGTGAAGGLHLASAASRGGRLHVARCGIRRAGLQEFRAPTTGITVLPTFDTNANKSVGLAAQIIDEASQPRCDVFWNSEILQTLRLDALGLLEEFPVTSDEDLPEMYRSPRSTWHALASRARVLIVNTELTKDDQLPRPRFATWSTIVGGAGQAWPGRWPARRPRRPLACLPNGDRKPPSSSSSRSRTITSN